MVGFGGGSAYLALLVLMKVPLLSIPPIVLICNMVVAGGGFFHFCRAGHFRLKESLPFIIFSIPFAYIGGSMQVSIQFFSAVLGVCLFSTGIRLFFSEPEFSGNVKEIPSTQLWVRAGAVGMCLGFIAGLVGIGGGIFLSPFLILMKWMKSKEAAASASFFILVNSIAGLFGQLQKGNVDWHMVVPLGAAVFIGGQIGSQMGAYRISGMALKKLLGALIMFVSLRLLMNVR